MSLLWVVAVGRPTTLYHGSHDRLEPGTVLRPGGGPRNHELSEGYVYTHPDPGIARVFAENFHGPRAAVYEVHAPHAVPDDPEDPWNSQHLSQRAFVKRRLSDAEIDAVSNRIEQMWDDD